MQDNHPNQKSQWHNPSFWHFSVNSANSVWWPDYVCGPTPQQTHRNRAIGSRVKADGGIVPFNPAVALWDLPDLLLLRDLDPIPRQRNQPLHQQLTMVSRRPEDDDVAAGEVVAVEAALLHQRALGLLRVEGRVHGGAVHGDDGGAPVGDGDADYAASEAALHERPNGGQGSRHAGKEKPPAG